MRLSINALAFASLTSFAACGSPAAPPDAPKDVGFNKPTMALRANTEVSDGVWMDLGPVDLTSCPADVATADIVTLNTKVSDFQSGNSVPAAMVTAFPDVNSTAVFDTKTSDANGMISFTIPAGTKRYGFKMTGDFMPTFLLNQYVDPTTVTAGVTTQPSKIQSVSNATAATLPALIGETRTAGTGVIAGALRDCNKHEISNFVATVSSTPTTATPIAGAEAFYFSAGVGLPVHHNQQDAGSQDGIFMVIQLPPAAMAYVQMWGYPTDAEVGGEMKLVAELAVPVLGDTVITGSYEPKHN